MNTGGWRGGHPSSLGQDRVDHAAAVFDDDRIVVHVVRQGLCCHWTSHTWDRTHVTISNTGGGDGEVRRPSGPLSSPLRSDRRTRTDRVSPGVVVSLEQEYVCRVGTDACHTTGRAGGASPSYDQRPSVVRVIVPTPLRSGTRRSARWKEG